VLMGTSISYPTPPTSTRIVGGLAFSSSTPCIRPIMLGFRDGQLRSAEQPAVAHPTRTGRQAAPAERDCNRLHMCMADGAGQSVGGICSGHAVQGKQALHHVLDLFLGGAS